MFSKKVEKRVFQGLFIYFALFLLIFFIMAIVFTERNIDASKYNIYFQLGILIPLISILLYILIIKPIYLSVKVAQFRNFINTKQYTKLSKLCTYLVNKNSNKITKSLFCISLIYNKEYEEFIKFYETNQKSFMNEIRIYLFIVKFFQEKPVDSFELAHAKQYPKLMLTNFNISSLLEKIEQYYIKDYSKCLSIQLIEDLVNNDFFLLAYEKCNELSKKNEDLQ